MLLTRLEKLDSQVRPLLKVQNENIHFALVTSHGISKWLCSEHSYKNRVQCILTLEKYFNKYNYGRN